jgi:hypothetical protein
VHSKRQKRTRAFRVRPAIVIALVLLAIVGVNVTRHRENAATPPGRFSPAPAAPAARAAAGASAGARKGQASTYFVDPTTGLPREPTPQELLDLQQQTLQATEAPQPFTTDTGFTGLRLSDDQMTYTVATRNANGSVTLSHAQGRKDADRLVKNAGQGGIVAGKEQRLER